MSALPAKWPHPNGKVDGPDDYEDKDAFILGGEGGVKFFLTEYFAISGALVLEMATDDVYEDKDDVQSYDVRIEVGLRTFF